MKITSNFFRLLEDLNILMTLLTVVGNFDVGFRLVLSSISLGFLWAVVSWMAQGYLRGWSVDTLRNITQWLKYFYWI